MRALLTAIALLLGVIAALIGGILQRLDGSSVPQTIEYGCGAFAATVLFAFAILHFLGSNGTGTGVPQLSAGSGIDFG